MRSLYYNNSLLYTLQCLSDFLQVNYFLLRAILIFLAPDSNSAFLWARYQATRASWKGKSWEAAQLSWPDPAC